MRATAFFTCLCCLGLREVIVNVQGAPSLAQKVIAFQQAFWKFLRPHTIRGTILGSCAVTAKAVLEHPEVGQQYLDTGVYSMLTRSSALSS